MSFSDTNVLVVFAWQNGFAQPSCCTSGPCRCGICAYAKRFSRRSLAKHAGRQGRTRFSVGTTTPHRSCVQPPKLMANEAQGAQVIAAECHKSQVSGRSLTEKLPELECTAHLLNKHLHPSAVKRRRELGRGVHCQKKKNFKQIKIT